MSQLNIFAKSSFAKSVFAHSSFKSTLRPRHLLTQVAEFSLLGGIVAAMAVGIMRLQ